MYEKRQTLQQSYNKAIQKEVSYKITYQNYEAFTSNYFNIYYIVIIRMGK